MVISSSSHWMRGCTGLGRLGRGGVSVAGRIQFHVPVEVVGANCGAGSSGGKRSGRFSCNSQFVGLRGVMRGPHAAFLSAAGRLCAGQGRNRRERHLPPPAAALAAGDHVVVRSDDGVCLLQYWQWNRSRRNTLNRVKAGVRSAPAHEPSARSRWEASSAAAGNGPRPHTRSVSTRSMNTAFTVSCQDLERGGRGQRPESPHSAPVTGVTAAVQQTAISRGREVKISNCSQVNGNWLSSQLFALRLPSSCLGPVEGPLLRYTKVWRC